MSDPVLYPVLYLAGVGMAMILFGCVPYGPVSVPAVPAPVPAPAKAPVQEIPTRQKLPEEMTPLSKVQVLTRGGLAALLVYELPKDSFRARPEIPIMVDLRDHWAREEILKTVQLGLMPVFKNHRFLPDQPVSRGEMAQVLSGMIKKGGISGVRRPIPPNQPSDLPNDHLFYGSVMVVLQAGVMDLDAGGRVSVDQPVSGVEASEYIKKIKRLLLIR